MHIVDVIDRLLEEPKVLASAKVVFAQGNQTADQRCEWPVLVDGVLADCYIACTAYPLEDELRFTITLNYQNKNIWRVDYEPSHRTEYNGFRKGHPLSGRRISGPHYHSWSDNRSEVTTRKIPDVLPWLRELPDNLRTWENTFRWFLGQTNIKQPSEIPALPTRRTLL